MKTLPPDFEDALVTTVATALERMAFMVGEPVDGLSGEIHHAASIDVTVDGAEYEVCVSATDGALQELLSSLVDADGFDDEAAQFAVNELANVLGGEVLRVLGGDQRPSKLGLPRPGCTARDREGAVRAALDFLGESLEVAVAPGGSR